MPMISTATVVSLLALIRALIRFAIQLMLILSEL